MAEEAKSSQRYQRYEVDPDLLDRVEDDTTAMLHLWIHGRLTRPAEDLDAGVFILGSKIEKASNKAEKAFNRSEDVQKAATGHIDDLKDAIGALNTAQHASEDAAWCADEACAHLNDALEWLDRLAKALDDYKNVVDELITEHHPAIPKAIKKAKLMKELE